MNPYKCTIGHKMPNELCIACFRIIKARHDRMLEFIKKVSEGTLDDSLEFLCDLEDEAEELLKELGLNEKKDSE